MSLSRIRTRHGLENCGARHWIVRLTAAVFLTIASPAVLGAVNVTANGQSSPPPVQVSVNSQVDFAARVTNCPNAGFLFRFWRERWDFDGDGTWDQTNTFSSPTPCAGSPRQATHTYTSSGMYDATYEYGRCYFFIGCFADESGSVRVQARAAAGLADFQIDHDGAGINCLAEPITITALNNGGSTLQNYTGTMSLSTSSANGSWSLNTGGGTLSDPTADDGAASYQFVSGDNGQVILDLSDTHAETLTITASDGGVSSTSASITFRPFGFVVTPDPVGTRVAAKDFTLTLTAAGQTPGSPDCGVIEEYDGNKTIKFWSSYVDPGSGSNSVSVDGTAIATSEAGATDQTVAFTNGVADVTVNYPDAGTIGLQAKDDSGIGEPPAGSGDEVIGGVSPFVVRPFGFDIDFSGDRAANPDCASQVSCAADASGDVFTTAGAGFSTTVTAVVWQATDDGDDDGVPDAGADLTDNAATPNFGQESTPDTVTLTRALVAPAGGDPGTLSGGAGIGGFSGGAATTTLTWDDVGIIDLNATITDNDYQGGGEDVTGTAANVGRFIPDRFRLANTGLTDRVNRACATKDPFTYMAEDFENTFDIAAHEANGGITQNYEGAFAFLDPTDNSQLNLDAVDDVGTERSGRLTRNLTGAFANGVAPVTAKLRVAKADPPDGPFQPLHVGIAPEDPRDPVTLRAGALNLDVNGDDTSDHASTGATEIRHGRLRLPNAYGPETADLDMDLVAEYYTGPGEGWQRSPSDLCTAYDATAFVVDGTPFGDNRDLGSKPDRIAASDTSGPRGHLSDGLARPAFALQCPGWDGSVCQGGSGHQGWVKVVPASPGGRTDDYYLDYLDLRSGYATFGRYQGNDHILYWREVYH